jgi:glycosyltransferase involved in cell wall biosynthesis
MPEFEAIKPKETGIFFEKDNVNDLADKINLWFNNKNNKRNNVREACYKEIDGFWNPYFQIDVLKNNIKF